MGARILVRHTSGARANQVDEFQGEGFREVCAGRDENAAIRFDPERDDLVSRNHAKIYADAGSPNCYLIADLQSRNGTFLNRQRIGAPSRIHHGDVVQLGSGGPEFRFELDPPPASVARPTRAIGRDEANAFAASLARPTRVGIQADVASPRPIGRATVERMLDDTFGRVKRESGKTLWAGIAALIMIAALGAGAYAYMRHSSAETARRMKDQQTLLLQMAQVVKQQPTDDAAVRAQMNKLGSEMKRIIAENQALAKSAAPGGAGTQTAAPAQADGANGYDAGLAQAEQLYKSNDFTNAYSECVRISQIDPARWEGYYIAGLSAEGMNNPSDALIAYQYALSEAPNEAKATITARINALQGGGQAN
ncbi:MAG TPA: FHA domain-containing protein [Bryobacteraceae bacterium]|nr:FHA domain-containing protein [Bryobacteraceae bacterium]